MIDWLRGEIECLHNPLASGYVVSISPDGEVEWQCPKKLKVEGSCSSKITISSSGGDGQGRATHLRFDGNPSKFLQGHNVDGTDDLHQLVLLQYKKICDVFPELYNDITLHKFTAHQYQIKGVDINYLYDLLNNESVESWLHAAEFQATTRHGRPNTSKGTLYFGKNSRRWSIKAYNKFIELTKGGKKHALPHELKQTDLIQYSEGKLRVELRLLSLELEKLNLQDANNWKVETVKKIFNDYIERIEMNAQATLLDQDLQNLSHHLRGTYFLWQQGVNVRQMLSIRTFYRHRRALKEFGIDINYPCANPEKNNVVPLRRVLDATPCQTPDWMKEQGLIVC